MDYKLEGPANIRMEYEPVVAINVSNDIRDSQGNIIKLKPATQLDPIKFNVKENTENPDPESVKGKNVGSYQNFEAETSNYNSNINHEIQTVIDQTGAVLVNDYSVKQGMVYVEEDISTVPKTIIDVEGNTWIYRYSYIETEYVYRNDGNENKLHVSDKSTSGFSKAVPEVLGDHYIGGVNEFNTFVEFFAHNVYDKVIPPTKEEVNPYEGNGELGGVKVGDEIEYKITYTNYASTDETVTITDTLDKNVEFVSASDNGSYDEANHTVTWTLEDVEAGKKGSVTLTVKVLKSALESNGGPGKVFNGGSDLEGANPANTSKASVKVGNDPEQKLEEVENPVPETPVKKEISPYKGTGELGPVNVGDSITYEISYKNYKSEKADIVITDKLDKNVEFVKCSDDGVYDEATHTVTWTLKSVAAEEEGTVNLTVKVLDGALDENGGPGIVINGGNKESGHATSVKVGTDNEFYVEEVINPVPMLPAKREIAPYEGFGVLGGVDPGTEITYEILFKNYKTTAADVVISDELDENVEFVEASDGGVYDEDTHTVTWTLKQVAAKKEGRVTLTVVVLEDALESEGGPGKVVNGGNTTTVKVGDDQEVSLDVVENPVPKYPSKKEIAPYEGNGVLGAVTLDDVITYKIYFQNYKDYDADVVITDQLDPNVEFVDASDDGVYDEETHTVTWVFENYPARLDGDVWVDVKVLESALESNGGPGKVVNGGETSTVRVGNDAAYTLEIVENPVPELPVKVEIAPYEGSGSLGPVSVGDEITYELFYKNYKDEAADIYIYDPLDYYVDFISASDDGEYDEEDHSVEWILKDVPAGEEGSVTLTVKVLKDALVSEDGDGYVINGEGAFVQVGDDWEIYYNIVQNPVPDAPVKRETAPYKGNGVLGAVKVGDEITYEIVYRNYYDTYQNIVIKDKLDPNVEFVRASDNGKYDKATHTVTWLLEDVPDGEDGKVTLTVKVLEGALKSNGGPGKVVNGGEKATVKVGDDDEFTLDMVENPVDEEEPPVDEEVGNLTIIVTEKGTGRPVPGAVVEVKNPKGKTTEYTTDEAGKVTLTDIPVGDYTVTIKKVPDGYNVTTDEVMTATVVAGKTTTVEFKIIPPTDTAVKTGDPMQLMPFMLVMLISMAGMILVIRRKRKQDR